MILRVALVQINTIVGDLVGNRDKILAWMDRAREMKADIVAFPEMAITGYPPEDLLLKPDFVEAAVRVLHEIVPASEGLTLSLAVCG
jgi:NAD+ synthase (glutamine-hydrolysing)